jgi:hypothetical protein
MPSKGMDFYFLLLNFEFRFAARPVAIPIAIGMVDAVQLILGYKFL